MATAAAPATTTPASPASPVKPAATSATAAAAKPAAGKAAKPASAGGCGCGFVMCMSAAQKEVKGTEFLKKGLEAEQKGDLKEAEKQFKLGADYSGECAYRCARLMDPVVTKVESKEPEKTQKKVFETRLAQSKKYYETAGKMGYGEAYLSLAMMCSLLKDEYKTKEDDRVFLRYLKLASYCPKPSPAAQFNLALCFITGLTIQEKGKSVKLLEKDAKRAKELLEKSKVSILQSFYELGNLYKNEFKDASQAEKSFEEGAKKDDPYCAHELALLKKQRGDIEGAKELLQQSSMRGHGPAMLELGLLLLKQTTYTDIAGFWLEKASTTPGPHQARSTFEFARYSQHFKRDEKAAKAAMLQAKAFADKSEDAALKSDVAQALTEDYYK